jgi:hypothetical protein
VRIFISWSGPRSRAAALALRDWLPVILHFASPWMSEPDIPAGERWAIEIGQELETARFGIVVLTKDNLTSPWLLFEAGAIAKAFTNSAVVPYLVDVEFQDIVGPLSQFQGKRADRDGTRQLIDAINAKANRLIDSAKLDTLFNALWPLLANKLGAVPVLDTRVTLPSRDTVLETLVADVRSVAGDLRKTLERLERKSPEMPAIDVSVEGTFPRFVSGQTLTFEPSRNVIEEIANIAGVSPDDYGRQWDLVDSQRNKPLTLADGGAYAYRGRRSRLFLLLRAF